ncbi:dTDP-fucopyranose mutase [Tilletia horrida]|uniref:dTDP-fucopyranose mutase n=1 Tax=Tilletia horrida TaxID=155126 RepID=A0AAN6JZF4_9BASI|nr:dTDP-fucopyranose mutase [Tilletia horrida]KAK0554853.1 dTDP-fucopyranose mutase [Tilletia horrida]KAK0568199.1 dTDP-fucopyranose mutase [Tilletia horrida]
MSSGPTFENDPELAALLAASVQAASASSSSSRLAASTPFDSDGQQDVINFDQDEEDNDQDDLQEDEEDDDDEDNNAHSLKLHGPDTQSQKSRIGDDWQRTARQALSHADIRSSPADKADTAFDLLAAGQVEQNVSQRARKRQKKDVKSATAGDAWYDLPRLLPSSPSLPSGNTKWDDPNLTPAQRARLLTAGHKNAAVASDARSKTSSEIAREVQAIRLRNALDPKRFYRGARGDRALALPEFAQIGTIVADELRPRQNLSRAERSSTRGSVVEELLRDDTARDYASRKFGELQEARGSWQANKGQKRKTDGKKGKKRQRS